MLNQVMLIGRLVNQPESVTTDEGKLRVEIKLAITRSYKNNEGEYDTDFIPCVLWNAVAEPAVKYCNKGDLVAVKGRLEQYNNTLNIVVDKLSFLKTKKVDE